MSDDKPTLRDLEASDEFAPRHIGPNEADIAAMLELVEARDLEDLLDRAVPDAIRTEVPLALPPALSEQQALEKLAEMAGRNELMTSLIGMGYHDTITPSVIARNVFENPAWYTAYTPYQAEVSQGRLEALIVFQEMICDLTGMELANASLLDEATAAAEAMAMARRVSRVKADRFVVDADCHPQTLAVLRTRASGLGIALDIGDAGALLASGECFGVFVQNPGSEGAARDIAPLCAAASERGAIMTVACDLLSLVTLAPPGGMGADIVIGSAQRFGVPLGYGGPHAAFFATREAYKRAMPGRVIGVSIDSHGRQAYRMALQTREQHIRREKATSNICTAQVLLAIMAAFYAVYHGPQGLQVIASRVHRLTCVLAAGLRKLGVTVETACYFDTLTVNVAGRAVALTEAARDAGLNFRVVDEDRLGIALDETTGREVLRRIWSVLGGLEGLDLDIDRLDSEARSPIPSELARQGPILEHPVFSRYRSETEMMRYLRSLAAKDIALDRSMIPLGSCTMKLNAATEMLAVSWPGFAALHPFAPRDQAEGYAKLFDELEAMLCAITVFDAVSFQPNAGSQGEFTGLLSIRRYHESKGQAGRNICLIPASAHGTNPASAVMAGLRVVVVSCDDNGNVDVADLRAKAESHGEDLAALMITYPSTHGVFEAAIKEICEIVHDAGGQVYLDGANLNAMVGVCRPSEFGADVSHLNLHKTFCIPHGGGGPGMGPIGVKAHLAPFLPDHPEVPGVNPKADGRGTVGTVSAAPWGSPSILPISWAYIAMMGADGLRRATQVAILNANYVARRLAPHFPILYTGKNGMVAHECIIDLRTIKEACGISVEDVAKRLVDYGYHAPTMSFPVADTLMIEPTESEGREELDRFCEAMIAIRAEIADVESGEADAENNVLRNAPHTAELVADGAWPYPYSPGAAFYPLEAVRADKFWPPVGRVDNVYGDRNLICGCPPITAYDEAAD